MSIPAELEAGADLVPLQAESYMSGIEVFVEDSVNRVE